jgi:hypothetical protein
MTVTRGTSTLRYAEVLQALNDCVAACEQLVKNGFSPPQSLLVIDRATVLRWAEWSPMLERNPDLAETWLSLCANTCKSWAEAYRHHGDEAAQSCVHACERCVEACNRASRHYVQQTTVEKPETIARGTRLEA